MIKNLDHLGDHFRKKNFRNKLILATSPPPPPPPPPPVAKKFSVSVPFKGSKKFSYAICNYQLHILSYFYANIARLPFLGTTNCGLFRFFALLLSNIAQFLRKYCPTTFISTTNCGLFRFFAFLLADIAQFLR
jgi:hypothetical protein